MKEELIKMLSNFPDLGEELTNAIIENTTLKRFPKGEILLKEGEISKNCYSILKGCIRQYYMVDGEEKTTAFYTEGDPVVSFTSYSNQLPSKLFLICMEECVLTVGNQDWEAEMCKRFLKLESIIRIEVEKNAGKTQEAFATFITSSPEERYLQLLNTRADLLNRVPQHQIASFLGITAESLSRIRKRVLKK